MYPMTSTPATTVAFALAERLRADINEGLWPPGAALRQEDLAKRYGASRIPVREALNVLGADGLVTIEPNRGAYVARLTPAEVDEIFDLRVMLESAALAAALPMHSARTLLRLENAQAQLELEDTRTGWIEGDRAFHDALYGPSGRDRTLGLVRALRMQVERYGLPLLTPGTRRNEWAKEHRALIAAVRAKNKERAIGMLTRHLRETQAAVRSAASISFKQED
jgi:DNA-binding GntR family transcriptional regulator